MTFKLYTIETSIDFYKSYTQGLSIDFRAKV